MKKIVIIAAIILVAVSIQLKAQILTPVHWSYAAKKTSATEATIFIKANIDEGWHLYSQKVKEGGPVKTTIVFNPSSAYSLTGATAEPEPIVRNEKVFNMDIAFFEKSVIFQQKVKLKKQTAKVQGVINYMTCNDQKCLPPEDVKFIIDIK